MATAIIVPGLSGRTGFLRFLTRNWEKEHGIKVEFFVVDWKNDASVFDAAIDPLIGKIAELAYNKETIFLIGTSAGGSFVMNAFLNTSYYIDKCVNVCGRLKPDGHPSLDRVADGYPLFRESVIRCERRLQGLNPAQLGNVFTFSGWWDGRVPVESICVNGATNVQLQSFGHFCNIFMAFLCMPFWLKS